MEVELGCDKKQFSYLSGERQPFTLKVHQSFDQNGSWPEIRPHLPKGTPKMDCNTAVSRPVVCGPATKIVIVAYLFGSWR